MHNNIDFLARIFEQGVLAHQLAHAFPQFKVHGNSEQVRVMTVAPPPSSEELAEFLVTVKHDWRANPAPEGGVSCCKCGAWAMHRVLPYGCETPETRVKPNEHGIYS